MRGLFERQPIALVDLLRDQLLALSAQAVAIDRSRGALQLALSRIESGSPIDVTSLCTLIRDGECAMDHETNWKPIIDRYWSPKAQEDWLARMAPLAESRSEADEAAYQAQWRDLSNRIAAAMPLDPASASALGFVREWFILLEPFSKVATPEMWEASRTMFADMENWPTGADAAFSKPVWEFIGEATQIALTAGHDIGPAPPWMAARHAART